jgi:hypothetical protein
VNRLVRCALVGLVAAALIGSTSTSLASSSSSGSSGSSGSGLARLRAATVKYFDIDRAKADGHGELKDAAGIACIDSDEGGMGIHYVQGDLVADGEVRLRKPEAIIYEPQPDGYMELVAVEYVVFRTAWRAEHPTGRPHLLGQRFELVKAGNRYGLPAFFELHVWAFRHNPNGLFEDWNPRVTCEFAPAT